MVQVTRACEELECQVGRKEAVVGVPYRDGLSCLNEEEGKETRDGVDT